MVIYITESGVLYLVICVREYQKPSHFKTNYLRQRFVDTSHKFYGYSYQKPIKRTEVGL